MAIGVRLERRRQRSFCQERDAFRYIGNHGRDSRRCRRHQRGSMTVAKISFVLQGVTRSYNVKRGLPSEVLEGSTRHLDALCLP